jgi:glycosyltransferase involved in cell wall biosynthesis
MTPGQDRLVSLQPLVSVVIAAHNAGAFIAEALDSVLGQSYPNVEIIVVDDASTDDTGARVAAYAPRVRCIRHARSVGSAGAPRNTGMGHCTGEYLAFLDADDVLLPGRIEQEVGFLSSHPDIALVFSDYRNYSSAAPAEQSHFQTCPGLQGLLGTRPSLILSSEQATALLAQENFGISSAFMIRTAILGLVEGFDPTLKACEDFHFYFRVARLGRVGVINKIGMMRRLHAGNMSSNPARMLSEGVRSRSLLRDSEGDSRTRAHLDAYIAHCHAALARHHADRGDYLRAIREDALALRRDFSAGRVRDCFRGVARTLAMAAGVHRPTAGES